MVDSEPASSTSTSVPDVLPPTSHRYRNSRSRRGNNTSGGERSQNSRHIQHIQVARGGSRAFSGRLTAVDTTAPLDAQAPVFIPASVSPAAPSNTSKSKAASVNLPSKVSQPQPQPQSRQRQRQRRYSRSTAPDIATRTHDDIAHNLYECAICTNELARNSKIWSCRTCWTVFHLGCVKKWSINEGSAVQQRQDEDDDTRTKRQWRCPGCNLPQDSLPSVYTCWCEKELDPRNITGLPPHSCGQSCGRDRHIPNQCPHPCNLICHAGPCPPCSAMGPTQSCFCGKQTATQRCIDTKYEAGWSCGSICGDMMPCGEHLCPKPCHEGLCGSCDVLIEAKCYCGKSRQAMKCNEKALEKDSYDWIGCYDCQQLCRRRMDCGLHVCQKTCHSQVGGIPHCPRSPDVVTHCPCGKTRLSDLGLSQRNECSDPIPNCQETCGMLLECGHKCTQTCHTDDCSPCLIKVPSTCRCGRQKFESTCYGGSVEPPMCFRACRATLNCGRHECGERCCTGERKAAERLASKRKLKPLGMVVPSIESGYEAEHICTLVCGRTLKCGNHTCQELCHKGPCGTCREAVFDDIACNCGRTILQAPLPCGVLPPNCKFQCQRTKACGHPQVVHNCHTDQELCPKCPFLTEKRCLCGAKTLKNQPCWRSDVLCGLVCRKMLKCGSHYCRKTCHRPDECEDATKHCSQECGKPKKSCGHPCEQPCHAPTACKEEKACPFKVMITCDCQRKKEEVRCNARAGAPDLPGRQTSLKCDEECLRLERNRKLAAALHISDDHTDDHIPYSTDTLNMYLEATSWAHKQEDTLRIFAADDNERRFRFPPMKPRQRAFLHSLAEDFGFDGESLDPEPHRHVVLFKTPKFVAAPMKTLAQAARIKRTQLSTISAVADERTEAKKVTEIEFPSWNAFLLQNPRFALTEDELRTLLASFAPTTEFDIHFLSQSDTIALVPLHMPEDPEQRTNYLATVMTLVATAITKSQMAASVVLAELSHPSVALAATSGTSTPTYIGTGEVRILRQSDVLSTNPATASSGWSQVVARRGPPPKAPVLEMIGQKPMYTVLGSKLAEAKRRKQEEAELARKRKELEGEVVDDWSAEADDDDM